MGDLDWMSVSQFKSRTPDLVATDEFKKALFENSWIKRSLAMNRYRLVVEERKPNTGLVATPELFLGQRQRCKFSRWFCRNCAGLRSSVGQISTQISFQHSTLGL